MRIAYILADPGVGLFGTKGASVHAQEMIRAFGDMGHQVTVYCTKRGNIAFDPSTEAIPQDLRDIPVFVVPVSGVKGAAAREQALRRAAQRMAQLGREEPYDMIYERYSLFSTAGALLAKAAAAPLVLEVNAPLLNEQSAHRRLHDAEGAHQATLASFAAAEVISCVTQPVADWVSGLIPPVKPEAAPRVIVTPNGVDPSRFHPSRFGSTRRGPAPGGTVNRAGAPFTVGFLGTLKPWHGTELLLEAFAAAPVGDRGSWRCEILGDGPQRQQLEQLAAQLGVGDQVSFRGAVAHDQVPAALAQWDVAVAPYPRPDDDHGHYFSPMKVYEYLAAGLPAVVSAVGDLPQIIDDGVTGMLVPGSDVAGLAAVLAQLAQDPEHCGRLGAAARAQAVAHHSWGHRAAAILNALHLQKPRPPHEVLV